MPQGTKKQSGMNHAERAGKLPSRLSQDTLFQIDSIVIRSLRLLFAAGVTRAFPATGFGC
jgi:hypothetical protein